MKKILLILLGLNCLGLISLKAQDQILISGKYQGTPFTSMVLDLESRYKLKFYFDNNLDSTLVTLDFKNITVPTFLGRLSSQLGANFFMANDTTIISTGRYQIRDHLGEIFFMDSQNTAKEPSDNKLTILESIRENVAGEKEKELEERVFEIGNPSQKTNGSLATITGYVKEEKTGEPVVGASVFKKNPLEGTITDPFGFFSLTLPKGKFDLFVSSIGMKSTKRQINLLSDGKINFELRDEIVPLKEVVVTAEKNAVETIQTGLAKINLKNIKQIPSSMGEADIMKIALTLPGVQTVGEGSAGFNVRGGGADQNLILLNDVPVFNTNHLFGFLSVFNPDVLAEANLYKSGISANYGGRISSVFDVALRDGNKKKFALKGGISPITTKLTLEGPIKKDSSSYMVGFRTTYSQWIFSLIENPSLRNSSANFYDVVSKINHKINAKNELIFSGYFSRDQFSLNSDSLYAYMSSNAAIQWRHSFTNRFIAINSVSFANYDNKLSNDINPLRSFQYNYNINHYSIKSEFNYFTKKNTEINFGISSTLYNLQPGKLVPLDATSFIESESLEVEKGVESAVYVGSEYEVNRRLNIYGGFRLSVFNRLGPGKIYMYAPDSPMEEVFITDTVQYGNNELMKTYVGPEFRFSTRYKLREDFAIKLSYDRMNQYIHILSNTASISPTDSWRLSDSSIKPQNGNQYSLGLYKTFYGTSLEMSLEGYYKTIANVLEYKDGASLLLNEAIETDIINAKSRSYGVEWLLKKNSGKLTGWLSYTYSRSLVQANGTYQSERINDGEFYPSNYDKPHAVILIANYKVNRRVNFSLNFNYSTGRPITFPVATYKLKGQPLLLYTDRNQYRIPDYVRVDVSANFEGNHKVHKLIHSSWSFSIYNLLSRSNAYSVFYRSEEGQIKGYKLSVFKSAIPTITYHFRLI